MIGKIREWLGAKRAKLGILIAILLVGVLCFEAGILQGEIHQTSPMIVTLPPVPFDTTPKQESSDLLKEKDISHVEPIGEKSTDTATCLFVGSKKSNKYHVPSCQVAKRIKPENKICFSSKEEAEKRGYVASCLK